MDREEKLKFNIFERDNLMLFNPYLSANVDNCLDVFIYAKEKGYQYLATWQSMLIFEKKEKEIIKENEQ